MSVHAHRPAGPEARKKQREISRPHGTAITRLQQTAGNAAVAQLLHRRVVQRMKVKVENEKQDETAIELQNGVRADAPEQTLKPEKTFIIRAQNSGDMYHMRAAMIACPEHKLLIWNVNTKTQRQAQQIADLHEDLTTGGAVRVYYTSVDNPPKGFTLSETEATAAVMSYFKHRTSHLRLKHLRELNPRSAKEEKELRIRGRAFAKFNAMPESEKEKLRQEHHYRRTIPDFAKMYAPFSRRERIAFDKDLYDHGFRKGVRYVLVLYRDTGHSERQGANAPALDTGLKGMQQIIDATRQELGDDVKIVPMGEQPEKWKGANLLNYWNWPSTKNRRKELALLRRLAEKYQVVGAVGMRSGVIDQLAFAGIKIVSIDISPHRRDNGLPNLKPSKGWTRGLKLESVYGRNYGRVFIKEARDRDVEKKVKDWKGEFKEDDIATIRDAIRFYLIPGSESSGIRHRSHPLEPEQVKAGLTEITKESIANRSAYDLSRFVRAYLTEVCSFNKQLKERDPKAAEMVEDKMSMVSDRIAEIEAAATGEAKTDAYFPVAWMQDNQFTEVLHGHVDSALINKYTEELHKRAAQPKNKMIRIPVDVNPADLIATYQSYHHAYSKTY